MDPDRKEKYYSKKTLTGIGRNTKLSGKNNNAQMANGARILSNVPLFHSLGEKNQGSKFPKNDKCYLESIEMIILNTMKYSLTCWVSFLIQDKQLLHHCMTSVPFQLVNMP